MTDSLDTAYDYVQKFCIVGNASVGKSSVLVQLTDKRFIGASSEPTIGVEFGSRLIDLDNGQKIKLQVRCRPAMALKRHADRDLTLITDVALFVSAMTDLGHRRSRDLSVIDEILLPWCRRHSVMFRSIEPAQLRGSHRLAE